MRKTLKAIVLLLTIGTTCIAQIPDTAGTIRPWLNTPGYEFPRIDKDMRAIFRLKAPNAAKVQVDLAGMNDGVMGADAFTSLHQCF